MKSPHETMKTRHGIVAVTCTALPLAAAVGAVTRGARGNENAESAAASDLFEKYRYTPKQIDPEIAAGGLDRMIKNGVFKKNDGKQQQKRTQQLHDKKKTLGSSRKTESRRKLQLRSGIPDPTGAGTDTTRAYDSYEGAAWSPVYDDDDGWYYDDAVQDDA